MTNLSISRSKFTQRAGAERLALLLSCLLAGFAIAGVMAQGPGAIGFPTKAFAGIACGACALALTLYRPVLFPFLAFVLLIPFDTMLQTGGGTITKFVAIATMATLLLVMVDRKRTVTPPMAVVGWLAFITWSAASLMWALDPMFGLPVLLQVVQLFLMLTVLSMFRIKPSEFRLAMLASLAGGVACALFGVYWYFSGHIIHEDHVSQRLNVNLSYGTYINADHFAAALVFPMTIALVGFLRLTGWKKVASALLLAVMAGGVFVTATRGSIVALGVVFAYVAIVERQRIQLIVVGVGSLLVSLAIPSVWQRFADPEQAELGGRSGIWAVAKEAFQQHWLAGAGTGDFRLAYSQAYIHVAQHSSTVHPWFEDSHNLIASTAVELGVIGIIVMLAAWFLQFRVTRSIPRAEPFGAYRSIVEAATLGLFVAAMTVDMMWYKYLWIVFMLGVLTRNAWLGDAERRRMSALAPAPQPG